MRGKPQEFVILRDQTLPLPSHNMDLISERIKGPGSSDLLGLTACFVIPMPDHIASEGFNMIEWLFGEHWVQVSGFILTIVTKNKAFVVETNALMIWNCESAKLKFKPWFNLVFRIWPLQYVIFDKNPMDHPGIFHCTYRISVSNYFKSHMIESPLGTFAQFPI